VYGRLVPLNARKFKIDVDNMSIMMTNWKVKAESSPEDDEPVPPAVEQQINENLQRLYRSTLEEELPDNLKQLLIRLKDREKQDEDASK
jgi:hypothetical protein